MREKGQSFSFLSCEFLNDSQEFYMNIYIICCFPIRLHDLSNNLEEVDRARQRLEQTVTELEAAKQVHI